MDTQEAAKETRTQAVRNQWERLERYRILNEKVKKGEILFTGSSLMEQFPIDELRMTEEMDAVIYNRGIGGFTTEDMLQCMEEMVFGTEPGKIFINIGTNDISASDYQVEKLIKNYRRILSQIKERLPQAKVYLMAYYPMNELVGDNAGFGGRTNAGIEQANAAVQTLAEEFSCRFINVNDGLADETGRLKQEYTIEGIHMYANAYQVILQNLLPYLDEA